MLLSEYILDGTFQIDKFWPIKISKTLSDYTNGRLAPDISDYCKKQVRKSERKIKERSEALKDLKTVRAESLKKRAELEREMNEVESKLVNISNYTNNLNRSNQLEANDINKFKSLIKK